MFPWVFQTGDVSLVGLNSATAPDNRLQNTWAGVVSSAQLDRLDDRLGRLGSAIVVVHHNCVSLHRNAHECPWSSFRLRNASELRAVCARHDVALLVSAHHHVPTVYHGPGTPELLLPAACSFPNAYVLLTIDERGAVARLVPLASAAELQESYHAARTGAPLGQGILSLVERQFARPRRSGSFEDCSLSDDTERRGAGYHR